MKVYNTGYSDNCSVLVHNIRKIYKISLHFICAFLCILHCKEFFPVFSVLPSNIDHESSEFENPLGSPSRSSIINGNWMKGGRGGRG